MTINGFAFAATISMMLPMVYFLLASLTFFLRPLSDPIVLWMLRGLLNVYFVLVAAACCVTTLAFILANRPIVAIGIGVVGFLAISVRWWFLLRMDREIHSQDVGDATAVHRIRQLHWAGMLYNAVQFVVIVTSAGRIFPAGVWSD